MCFKDPEAQALKKQKKSGKQIRNEESRPNRVIAATERGGAAGIEIRNLPDQPPLQAAIAIQNFEPSPSLPTTVAIQNVEPLPSALEDDELEPWSVGAVIRRTSMLQAANEKKKAEEEAKARCQAMVEEDVEMPTIKTKPEVLVEAIESKEAGTGEITSTPNMASIGDGGSGVRATMVFGLPTTKKEQRVDLNAIAEDAEIRRIMEENSALAAKGSHNGKYGGAISSNPAHNQRAASVSQDRDTRKSGWARSGLSGSFAAAMDEPYYNYEVGASNGSVRSPIGNNPYGSPYGYAGKRNSHYAYVSGPAN